MKMLSLDAAGLSPSPEGHQASPYLKGVDQPSIEPEPMKGFANPPDAGGDYRVRRHKTQTRHGALLHSLPMTGDDRRSPDKQCIQALSDTSVSRQESRPDR